MKSALLGLATAVVCLLALPTGAAQAGELQVTLTADSATVPTWGSLGVNLNAVNLSTRDVVFTDQLLYGLPYQGVQVRLLVQRPGEEHVRVAPGWRRINPDAPDIKEGEAALAPGDEVSARFVLSGRRGLRRDGGWAPWFGEPGNYTISITYSIDQQTTATSNTLHIRAIEPTSEPARHALEYVRNLDQPECLFESDWMFYTGCPTAPIEKLASDYLPNVYSDYAHLSLAKYRLKEAFRDQYKVDPPEVRRAIADAKEQLRQINLAGFPASGDVGAAQRMAKDIEKVLTKRKATAAQRR